MVWDDLGREAGDENQRDRDRWIGVYIGVLAVILAICSMGGGNASKEATLKNIEATNVWGFFQAKNMRRHTLRLEVDQLELTVLSNPALTAEARAAIEAKIADYKKIDAELTSNPKTNEGLDELFNRGKALEAERDVAMRQDPYFDYGEALLQIAIVLGGVAIISGGSTLLITSAVMGALGTFMTINGFSLFLDIPFIG
ncbi:MAG: DUF4337 domain-containing protein [Hyphomicrobium zavarzinii]|uniref:DUF4337 domain-containing protein n=1 Tax=Hyphomicrobium TaxID=81 RepID=UPI0003614D9A|nr:MULTISPECIES: DUF4337 domain-containing protein [Hyphomicrobium]MBL8846451.1 DUF4337 domain-containing protein [Hyphomicrobium zavarzinii]WBT38634.1 DUF4337 domain-containing protein [Hyphomicrobium sp. DMF-1]HML43353.1 DUF4337 domain-containing protein [Hyphomicrobium zavarzinii]